MCMTHMPACVEDGSGEERGEGGGEGECVSLCTLRVYSLQSVL